MKITAELDYVEGHLRYGHLELDIDKEKWESMGEDERLQYFRDYSEVVVDDYEINGYDEGSIKYSDLRAHEYGDFVILKERNDSEGETWCFALQIKGNEEELEKLAGIIKGDDCYTLDLSKRFTERDIDVLIEGTHDLTSYMSAYTKCLGKMTVPPLEGELWEYIEDFLYKGGVVSMFKEQQ